MTITSLNLHILEAANVSVTSFIDHIHMYVVVILEYNLLTYNYTHKYQNPRN